MNHAYIVDAIRTPFGRYGGALSSVRTDDLGAIPIRALMARNPGVDWAAVAMPTTRAFGVRPCFDSIASLDSSSAHAPSLTPEALPAVTVPSGRTTPVSFASASIEVSRGCSSFETTIGSPFFWAIVTGVISASK